MSTFYFLYLNSSFLFSFSISISISISNFFNLLLTFSFFLSFFHSLFICHFSSPLFYSICILNSKFLMYLFSLTHHPSLLNATIITVRTELYVCTNETCDKTYRFPRYNDVSKVSKGAVSHPIFFTLHVTYRIMNQCTYINTQICTSVRAS